MLQQVGFKDIQIIPPTEKTDDEHGVDKRFQLLFELMEGYTHVHLHTRASFHAHKHILTRNRLVLSIN